MTTNGEGAPASASWRPHDVAAVLSASIPFSLAGFGILELPIRWGDHAPFSPGTTGLVLAAFGLGYGAAQIPSGVLTSRIGADRLLRIAVVGCLASWALVLAPQWPLVGAGRLLFGFGGGLTFSSGLMLLRERVHAAGRTTAVAAFGSAWAAGNVGASLLGQSKLLSALYVGTAAAASLALLRPRPPVEVAAAPPERQRFALLWTTGVKVMLLVVPAGLLGLVALATWGPRTASGAAGASVVAVGLLVAAGIFVGNWLGNLVSRLPRANAIVAASPVPTGLLLALFAASGESRLLRLLAVFLAVTISVINFPPGMARVFRETPPAAQPFATAVINQAGWLGSAIGPVILGLSTTGAEPPPAAWVALAGVVVAAGLAAYTINRKGERGWSR